MPDDLDARIDRIKAQRAQDLRSQPIDSLDARIDRIIAQRAQDLHGAIVDSVDADPKKAAKAAQMSDSLGADPGVVYHDFDNVNRDVRTGLTNEIVKRNPVLSSYVLDNPLNAKISRDDWGNLSSFMDTLSQTPDDSGLSTAAREGPLRNIISETTQGISQGIGKEPFGMRDADIEKLHLTPAAEAQFKANRLVTPGMEFFLWRPFDAATQWFLYDAAMRISIGGVAGGLAGFLGSSLEEAGVSSGTARRGARSLYDLAELGLQLVAAGRGLKGVSGVLESERWLRSKKGIGREHPEIEKLQEEIALDKEVKEFFDSIERALPYVRAGEQPPIDLDPNINKMIVEDSRLGLKELKDQEEAAEKTQTKQYDANTFGKLAAKATKESMGIEFDGVKALYGDKFPEPGDGLLGDVPGIQEQFKSSLTSNADIIIPKSVWLSKVGKDVYDNEKLEGFIKYRPEAMSEREADLFDTPEAKAAQPVAMRPGGSEWQNTVDGVRRAAGLNPLFEREVGAPARKLQLVRGKPIIYPELRGEHSFMITDEVGRKVADLELTPMKGGKELYVNWIGGHTAPHQNVSDFRQAFGFSVMKDLMKQIKQEFPKAETIAGHRISGARSGLVTEGGRVSIPLRMEGDEDFHNLHDIIESGDWKRFGPQLRARIEPTEEWTAKEQEIYAKVQAEIQRLAPKLARVVGARDISMGYPEEAHRVYGAYQVYSDRLPVILWSLLSKDPLFSGRHEAIHHLRKYGFFTPQEWTILRDTAIKEKWIDRHDVSKRYPDLNLAERLEESIADEFASWAELEDVGRAKHPVAKLFERLGELLSNIKNKVLKKVFGRVPDANEIFGDVYAGRIGAREERMGLTGKEFPRYEPPKAQRGREPEKPETRTARIQGRIKELNEQFEQLKAQHAAAEPEKVADFVKQMEENRKEFNRAREALKPPAEPQPTQLELPYVTRQEHIPIFERGAILPVRMHDRYTNLIDQSIKRDADRDFEEAARVERRKQAPEWNRNFLQKREEVANDIQNTRIFRTNDFFRNGKLAGDDLGVIPKLRTDSLTPEQQKAVPKRWQAKNGIDPDIAAGPLGYHSGLQMLDDIVQFEEMRQGEGPKDFFNRLVKRETDRRMEAEYGKFEENVAAAAREHVISPIAFDMVNEEVMALAMKAGQAMPMSKENLRAQVALDFTDQNASKQDLIRNIRELGKAGREAEVAWLKGDVLTAFKQKQLQRHLMAVAELSKKFQKEQKKWERAKKTFTEAETTSVPQEYHNYIQELLYRVGEKPKRALTDIAENIAQRGTGTVKEFAEAKNKEGLPPGYEEYEVEYNPKIPVADFVYDPAFKKTMDQLTVGEFRMVNNMIQSLIKRGRGERKIFLEGRELDRKEEVQKGVDAVQTRPDKAPVQDPKRWDKVKKFLKTQKIGLMQPEAFFRMFDLEDPRGWATSKIIYPIMRAGNEHDALRRKFAVRIRELDKWKTDLTEKIDNNVFYNPTFLEPDENGKYVIPTGGTNYLKTSRESLRTVLLNYGNESNLKILAEGYLTTPEAIKAWVDKYATLNDFKWAQAVGKIFADTQRLEDEMIIGMSGYVIEKIPLGKVQTRFGEMDGWYYPAIQDRSLGASPGVTLTPRPKIRVAVPHGWANVRTGATYPIDLHMQMLTDHIDRRLRHIALHPTITEVSKILFDKDLKRAITRKFGNEYNDMLEQWLKDITGQGNFTAGASASGNRALDAIRVNTIATMIGWNPGTLIKHSSSAFAQSWREVGTEAFLTAMRDLYRTDSETMKSNHDFIMKGAKIGDLDWEGSTEVQRRRQHWVETFGGAYEAGVAPDWLARQRQRSIEIGSMPVGSVDQWISKVTWLAKYREVRRENTAKGLSIEEAHMDAVDLADRAVRNTHGSTMIAARPEFMRSQSALAKNLTSLYGFFNHILNRYLTMASRTAEAARKYKRGESIKGDVYGLMNDFAWYVVFPTAVEEYMEATCKPGDSWAVCGGKWLAQGLSAPIAGVREIAHAAVTGHDPSFGMLTQSYKAVTDMVRSLNPKNMDKYHFGTTIEHASTLAGIAGAAPGGVLGKQTGRFMKYLYNNAVNVDRLPKDRHEAYQLLRFGTTKKPKGY